MTHSIAVISAARALSLTKQVACVAVAATSLSLFAVSASAHMAPPQRTVAFQDLDLAKTRDTTRLYRRLKSAASEVCSQFKDHRGAAIRARRLTCESQALENAVAYIGHPSLTALHTSKSEMKLAQSKAKASPNS